MPTCPCGQAFTKTTNKHWCSQSCPVRKRVLYERCRRWYLRNKAKPYQPNATCPCGRDFIRRYGGREQVYCSSRCRQKYLSAKWRDRRVERRHLLNRKSTLKRHGLTHDEYLALYDKQDAKCAICGDTDPGSTYGRKRRYFSIDHCHTTGVIRGLLCSPCNIGLGSFRDNPDRLRAAADYLARTHDTAALFS